MHPQQSNTIKIAVVQARCVENKSQNLDNVVTHAIDAAEQGADLICLQELFSTRYFCQSENHDHFQLAEPIPGPMANAICKLAEELEVVLVASIFERRSAGVYHNTAIVVERNGEIVGKYRKMHIPDDPFYYEKFYFTPGDLGFRAFDTSVGKIGICICWDQWFPEAARLTALSGAQILVYPTAIGWLEEDKQTCGQTQVSAWKTMMRSHAIANGVFVAAPNRVGQEDQIEFWGNSFVCDPYGEIVAEAPEDLEMVIMADCDLNTVETARTHWPFLRDRRIDAYADLTRRFIDD